MPVIIPKDIPAFKILDDENVFVMSSNRAMSQDIRPIEIAIFNLMPTKIKTESQLIRLLANSPLQVNITLFATSSYEGKNTPKSHLDKFYKKFDKHKKFDGFIVTGAPVELMEYEEVAYWEEMKEVFDFIDANTNSAIYICWGALAGLYYYYGIPKKNLNQKVFGIFPNKKIRPLDPLFMGCDDLIYMPHSRHSEVNQTKLKNCPELLVLCESQEAGVGIIKSNDNKKIFIIGHLEYDKNTLEEEYQRDRNADIQIAEPKNYFKQYNEVIMNWRSGASLIFSNWLNYYVYQITPYDLNG
ncbi:homoserine O-succinyltransferase [Helicobacter cappadocius]|uniref:Homoserine O-acetyltransferase n=1 Tax=Helicobacter cappadocius TaxID=3063998 RepID=A0AA90PQF2_9HELI|nr:MULTISPECIES: homoserine O-succinyltransferase [unclassified Helicobacter]MDO7252375.1 homoserine O-succinyltransferase [Helicobacter sp. faydin-H75]MDP2538242.1 homoserine O-succinyltransferase [Helicobacter sp. faydin-H76]